jgi:hypothetical protein
MIGERKAANAMRGKTARACDSCLRRRARWFCAADDAFLCQACDASVHSANQLASRHERVRLQTSSFKLSTTADDDSPPAWHRGFTRKARTPRNNHKPKEEERGGVFNPLPFVPEIGSEEGGSPDAADDDDEQLLYRVPVFDPFAAELCNEMGNAIADERTTVADDMDDLHGLLPSDMELAEFAADVESLLGKGVADYSCDIGEGRSVKVEEEEELEDIVACQFNPTVDMMRETLDWNIFDYDESPAAEEKVEQKVAPMAVAENKKIKGEMFLRLNYEAVIAAWASHVSPWTAGARPELNPHGCSSDFLVLFFKI